MQTQKEDLKEQVIEAMKNLGTYREEFLDIIDLYAGLLDQYKSYEKAFEESGYQVVEEYTNKAGATNMRKVPLLGAMEHLRKDIATYSDRLGLTPKAMETITAEKASSSRLSEVLSAL